MHQSKKGNEWHFGMMLHIGVDSGSGLVHSASATAGNVHDSQEVSNLLHGSETRFYGDRAYRGAAQRERLKALAPRAKDFTNRRACRNRPLSDADRLANRRKSAVRSKVEHPFLTITRHWGFAKVRYRGIMKNANRAFAMLALLNINKWGRPITGKMRPAYREQKGIAMFWRAFRGKPSSKHRFHSRLPRIFGQSQHHRIDESIQPG